MWFYYGSALAALHGALSIAIHISQQPTMRAVVGVWLVRVPFFVSCAFMGCSITREMKKQ
jgi:hypothetical protein